MTNLCESRVKVRQEAPVPRVVDERPVAKVSPKVFWRRGTISPFFHDRRKSFVSYRSDTASHFPSCEMAEAIRLV